MNRAQKLSITLAVISALSIGVTSFAQQETKQVPMGQQTTRESDRAPGLTRQPKQDNQGRMQNQNQDKNQNNQQKNNQNQNVNRQNQQNQQQDSKQTGGAADVDANQQMENEQQGTTVRGYW